MELMNQAIKTIRDDLWLTGKFSVQSKDFIVAYIKSNLPAEVDMYFNIELMHYSTLFNSGALSNKELFTLISVLNKHLDCSGMEHYWLKKELRELYLNRILDGIESNFPTTLFESNNLAITLLPADKMLILAKHNQSFSASFNLEQVL